MNRLHIPVSTMAEALTAMHLSTRVESPFMEQGGFMLVGPPGILKSTLLGVLEVYPDALPLSDVNARTLGRLKSLIASGSLRTLVLPELAKIYERADHTAANVEGTIRALASEGFSAMSYEDATLQRFKARCFVIGAMTPDTYEQYAERWQKSGFSRRFLWGLAMSDVSRLERAAIERAPIDLQFRVSPQVNSAIPDTTTMKERQELRAMVKYQPTPHSAQLNIMVRMLAALKWWYREDRRKARSALHTLKTFAHCLSKNGAEIVFP